MESKIEAENNTAVYEVRRAAAAGIGQFLIKVVIVVVAAGALLTYADNLIQDHLRQARTNFSGSQFWHDVEHKLDRLADPNAIDPKKRADLLRKFRSAAANYAPFIKAIEEGVNSASDSTRSGTQKK